MHNTIKDVIIEEIQSKDPKFIKEEVLNEENDSVAHGNYLQAIDFHHKEANEHEGIDTKDSAKSTKLHRKIADKLHELLQHKMMVHQKHRERRYGKEKV
jgi:hypothetical protein